MPYTPEQKAKILQYKGYDPAKYDLDDNNYVIEKQAIPQAEVTPTPQPAPSSALGAAGRSAKRSIIPALAGLGAAGGAAALTGGGALIPILAGLAGGVGSGYLQEKAIEASSTPEELAARQGQITKDVTEHPYASFGGALAPQLLGFGPSIGNVIRAGGTLLKGGDALAKANLANVGVGAGLGAVTEGVLPYLQGGEANVRDVLLGAGAGALLNKPQLLGKMLFPARGGEAPTTEPVVPPGIEDAIFPSVPPTGKQLLRGPELPRRPVVFSSEPATKAGIESAIFPKPTLPLDITTQIGTPMEKPTDALKAALAKQKAERIYQQKLAAEEARQAKERDVLAKQLQAEREAAEAARVERERLAQEREALELEALKGNKQDNINVPPPMREEAVEAATQEALRKAAGFTPSETRSSIPAKDISNKPPTTGPLIEANRPLRTPEDLAPEPKGRLSKINSIENPESIVRYAHTLDKNINGGYDDVVVPIYANGKMGRPVRNFGPTGKQDAIKHAEKLTKDLGEINEPSLMEADPAYVGPKEYQIDKGTVSKGGIVPVSRQLKEAEALGMTLEQYQEAFNAGRIPKRSAQETPVVINEPRIEDPIKEISAVKGTRVEGQTAKPETPTLAGQPIFTAKELAAEKTRNVTPARIPILRGPESLPVSPSRQMGQLPPKATITGKLGYKPKETPPLQATKPEAKGGKIEEFLAKETPTVVEEGGQLPLGKEPIQAELPAVGKLNIALRQVPEKYGVTGKPNEDRAAARIWAMLHEHQDLNPGQKISQAGKDRIVAELWDALPGLHLSPNTARGILNNLEREFYRGPSVKTKGVSQQSELTNISKSAEVQQAIATAPKEVQEAHSKLGMHIKKTKSKGEAGFTLNPGELIYDSLVKVGRYLKTIYNDFKSWVNAHVSLYGEGIRKDLGAVWENITGESAPAFKGESPEAGAPRHETIKLGLDDPKYKDTGKAEEPGIITRVFESQTDKLKRTAGKKGEVLANAYINARNFISDFGGRWANKMLSAVKGLSSKEYNKIYKSLILESRSETILREELPEELRPAYDKLREAYVEMRDNQIEADQPVMENGVPRPAKKSPTAWFHTMDRKVIDILGESPDSPAAINLRDDYITYLKENGIANPEEEYTNFIKALSSKDTNAKFAAVRKAEGIGLPDSWIEDDFKLAIKRYTRRFASDRAFYDNIENNPEVMWLLGEKKDSYGRVMPEPENPAGSFASMFLNPEAKSIMEQIQGNYTRFSPTVNAASRVVNALILGPITGVTDVLSTPFNMMKFLPATEVGRLFKSIGNWREGYSDAIKNGLIKRDFTTIDELMQVGTNLSDKLNSTANFVAKISGRQATEVVARTLAQTIGNEIANFHLALAKAGNKRSIDLLNQVSPGKKWDTMEASELGTRFAELAQGRYDFSSLPKWANDSMLAPLVKLSRWNIEQANNFMKYVWEPLKKGNAEPLLLSIFGGVVGGSIIQEVREVLNSKETNVPGWMEIASSERGIGGNIPALAYQLMTVTGYTGVSGAFADIIRGGFDTVYGNMPTGYKLPLYEVAAQVGKDVTQATAALMEAGNLQEVGDIALKLSLNLLGKNVQVLRIGVNSYAEVFPDTLHGKEQARKKEGRDLRVFKTVEGLPLAGGGGQTNPYLGSTERRFKLAETPGEVMDTIGPALQKTFSKHKGDPEGLLRGINNLKYSTALNYPSPETSPSAFVKYGKYLERTKGKEEAAKRLQGFLRRREVNRMKSSLLGS